MRERRQSEIIVGRIAADGSVLYGDGFTVVKIGSGIYDIYFPSTFRLQAVTGQSHATSYGATVLFNNAGTGTNMVRVGMNNTSTAAQADTSFSFIAAGVAN